MNSDEILKAELEKAIAECNRLRAENAELKDRLQDSDITPQETHRPRRAATPKKQQLDQVVTASSSPESKVALFRNLFRGRDDVYPVRWERNGKTGYSPAGIREWDRLTSPANGKKSFHYAKLFPLTDEVIKDHLLGKQTIGVYPLLQDDTCW